jgi:hypothetical protein
VRSLAFTFTCPSSWQTDPLSSLSSPSPSHLPATLIASFIKRLARLSLSAPPSAIIMTIPFIYNLLKLHPSCMVLIHRDNFGGIEPSLDPAAQSDGNKGTPPSALLCSLFFPFFPICVSSFFLFFLYISPSLSFSRSFLLPGNVDPYDASHPNPLQSNALDSSLWEIATHQKHYLSSVSSLAKIFTEVFTKPRYGMEDFLDHTYVTVSGSLSLSLSLSLSVWLSPFSPRIRKAFVGPVELMHTSRPCRFGFPSRTLSQLFETESKRKLRNDPALALPVTGDAFPAAKKLVGKKKRKAEEGKEEEDDDDDGVDVVSRDVVSELFTF